MKLDLNGRWAVVTGASAGIGAELARELAARGCSLVLVARREDRLRQLGDDLAERHGIEVRIIAKDLSRSDAAEALATQLQDLPVSILVNNAGFALSGPFDKPDWSDLARMVQLNILFLTEFTYRMLDRLKRFENGAGILNVGSITGYQGVPFMTAYAGTKAFVNNFSEGLNWELRGSGVWVTCLEPGKTDTEFFQAARMSRARLAVSGLMTSRAVARQGVQALVDGRSKVVAGWWNWIRVFSLRFSPRWMVKAVITGMFGELEKTGWQD